VPKVFTPQCRQKWWTIAPCLNRYCARSFSPDRGRNWVEGITVFQNRDFPHTEQLQRLVSRLQSIVHAKRTAPQWQLPLWRRASRRKLIGSPERMPPGRPGGGCLQRPRAGHISAAMAEHTDTSAPYSGAQGPEDEEFYRLIRETLPDYPPDEAADAVLCALAERVSGAVARKLVEDLPASLRHMARPCSQHQAAPSIDKDEFYEAVSDHLNADGRDVRRILSAVFSAVQANISRRTAEEIASQLPAELTSTWVAAGRRRPGPH